MAVGEALIVRDEQDCIAAANQVVWGLRRYRKEQSGLAVPIRDLLVELVTHPDEEVDGVGFSIGMSRYLSTIHVGFMSRSEYPLMWETLEDPGVIHPDRPITKAWDGFASQVDRVPPPGMGLTWSQIHHWNLMNTSWDNLDQPLDVLACVEFQH